MGRCQDRVLVQLGWLRTSVPQRHGPARALRSIHPGTERDFSAPCNPHESKSANSSWRMLFSRVSYPAVGKTRGLPLSEDLAWNGLLLRTHLGLVLPMSSCTQGFSDVLVLREEQHQQRKHFCLHVSKGLHCFGKKEVIASSNFFSQSISELKKSFESASDTQVLQELIRTAFDPSFLGFPMAMRAKTCRAQRLHWGCLLDFSLRGHLSFGAAAEHFVSYVWAKRCSGSHPSARSLSVLPYLPHTSTDPSLCLQWLDAAPRPSNLLPCRAILLAPRLRTVPSQGFGHQVSTVCLTVCPIS